MMPFDPNDELTVKMTAVEWNQIIATMNDGTYRIVAPLISKMTQQLQQQAQPEPSMRVVPKEPA